MRGQRPVPHLPTLCDQHFIDGCTRPSHARGMCVLHYQRFRTHGDPQIAKTNHQHDGRCTIEGCTRRYYGSGLCRFHLHRRRRHGDPTLAERLTAAQNGQCAICGRMPETGLQLDHCHDTGRVRGMLCGPCNKALGLFADDPARLESAAAYLRSVEVS